MNNSVEKYLISVAGEQIDVDGVYGHQCTDLAKHFAENVWERPIGSFGGSAKTGWLNKVNTFPEDEFLRIENNLSDPNQVPLPGDMIFWANGTYGHVGIVLSAVEGQNKIRVINQNVGNGDGEGYDDRAVVTEYTYNGVAGWYRYKKFICEYAGLPVFHAEQPESNPGIRGFYKKISEGGPYIIVFPHLFNFDEKVIESILEHEYAHYVYFEVFSEKLRRSWENQSNLPAWLKAWFLLKGKNYTNAYLNSHAKTSPSEDFAECWEYYILNGTTEHENSYIQLKIETVVAAMGKYDPRVV